MERVEREERPRYRRYFDALPYPSNLPAFDRILEDDAEFVWLRDYRVLNQAETTWLGISPTGSLVAQVSIPGSFDPMHIGADFIAGVALDALDREHVLVVSLLGRR